MKAITTYGPGLVVLGAVAAVLVGAPAIIRNSNEAHTDANVQLASQRLNQTDVLALINQAQRDVATVVEPSVVKLIPLRAPETASGLVNPDGEKLDPAREARRFHVPAGR